MSVMCIILILFCSAFFFVQLKFKKAQGGFLPRNGEQKIIVITKTYKRFAIAFKLEYKFMYVIRSALDKYKVDFSSLRSYNLRCSKKKGNKNHCKINNE